MFYKLDLYIETNFYGFYAINTGFRSYAKMSIWQSFLTYVRELREKTPNPKPYVLGSADNFRLGFSPVLLI